MITLNSLSKSWNTFFFEEKPTEGIGLFRILWMGLILFYYCIDIPMIDQFYGPYSIVSQATVREQFPDLHMNLFNLFNPTVETTYGLFAILLMSLAFSCAGFFTKTSLVVAFVLMTTFQQRNMWLLSSSELLMRTITFLLIFSPCNHSYSIDSYLSKFYPQFLRPKMWPVWSLRLIQIQLSVVYLWTVWHKLKGDTWFDGTAVYYATRLENLRGFSIPYILDSLISLKILTWGTLIVETFLGLLLWVDEFRKPLIWIGIIFHLTIQYIMSIPFFEIFMILLLINFFTPEEMKRFADNTILNLRKLIASGRSKEKLSPSRG